MEKVEGQYIFKSEGKSHNIYFCSCFHQNPGCNGETNETPANSYTNVKTLIANPSGNRIDYIFYQASSTHKVQFSIAKIRFSW